MDLPITATINTDASFCPMTRAAGYALWISSDLGKVKKHDILKEARHSIEAEMQAIANAISVLQNHEFYRGKKFDKVWINSDCTHALKKIKSRSEETDAEKFIKKTLDTIIAETGEFLCRHVKAHKMTGSSRSYVNDWCDRRSRESMKIRRKEINEGR